MSEKEENPKFFMKYAKADSGEFGWIPIFRNMIVGTNDPYVEGTIFESQVTELEIELFWDKWMAFCKANPPMTEYPPYVALINRPAKIADPSK